MKIVTAKIWPVVALSVMLTVWIFPSLTWAQAYRGAIKGQVEDQTHAVVAGAQVSLKNQATGVVSTTVSGKSGEFSFLNLIAGHYRLISTMQGFQTNIQQDLAVNLGSTVAVTVMLQAGETKQTVTVSANSASVESQTSEIGTTVTPQEIKDLPLPMSGDSRNPLSFVLLTPGVSGSEPGATPDYRLHISGSVSEADQVYIDGVPVLNTNEMGNLSTDHPPLDSISAFKVITNNQTAEYGLASGIVSFGFRSGTNDPHGSLFEYVQNSALNAAGYVTDALHQKKAPLSQNEYGGTFGGPVRIPKLYDGRNKTFFFVDYTGFRYRPSYNNAALTTIPNEYRTGNFSQSLGTQLTSAGAPVFDPAGRPVYNGEIYDPLSAHTVVGPDGKDYVVREPFPGNIIPTGQPGLSTVSQTILNSFPQGDNNALFDNLFRNQATKTDEQRVVVKINETISPKHSLYGSIFMGTFTTSNNGGLNDLDASLTTDPTKQFRVTYNYTPSQHVFNNLNIGFLRDTSFNGTLQPGPGLTALGIQGLPPFASNSPYPLIQMGTLTNSIGSTNASSEAQNRFFEDDNLTLLHGRHMFTLGGEVRRLQRNETGIPGGSFDFEPTESGLNGTGFINGTQAISIPSGTGNPVASFLFGGLDFANVSYPISSEYRWLQTGVYFQDDWQATSDLTLNLGIRYDIQVPRTEVHGYASTMDPTLPNPDAGNLPGAYTYYGKGKGRNGMARIGKTDFLGLQPRIGFAYSPGDHKTAIRGGFAISRPIGNDNIENGISGTLYNTGFSTLATINRPQDYVGSPAYYWDNPFPSSSISGVDLNPGTLVGNDNPTMIHPSAGLPPTQLYWSAQVQQAFPGNMVASIGYVGMHTYHLGIWSKPNQINPLVAQQYSAAAAKAGLPLNDYLSLPVTDSRSVVAPPWSGFVSTFGSGATIGQALRPWPQYGDVDNPFNPIGSVTYNGLQTSLQKRISRGLTFLVSYTWEKTLGDVDSNSGPNAGAENAIYAGSFFQNYYDSKAERSVTSSDIPQVLSISYTYHLPIGTGQRFLNHTGVAGKVLSGWEVSGIQQYQSGRPIHIEYDAFGSSNPYFGGGDGFSFRPNIVPGQPLKNPAYRSSCSGPVQSTPGRSPCQFYINPAAFSLPPSGEFGNAPNLLGGLRMPRFYDEDLSIAKSTVIHNTMNLQIQANFFNAFNRTVFSDGGNAQTFIINNAPPDLSPASLANSSTVFGIMSAQQNGPRIIQFGARFEF